MQTKWKIVSAASVLLLLAGFHWLSHGERYLVRLLERHHPRAILVEDGPLKARIVYDAAAKALLVNGQHKKRWSHDGAQSIYRLKAGDLTRLVRGRLLVRPAQEGPELEILLDIGAEDYVAGVAASEVGPGLWLPEYAKSMAAVVRQVARQSKGRHGHYDLCDLTHCQVFAGMAPATRAWQGAVHQTKGLAFHDGPGERKVLFHAVCGGTFDSARAIWGDGKGPPAEPSQDSLGGEILCSHARFYRWERFVPLAQLLEAAGFQPSVSKLESFRITERTPGGRARTVEFKVSTAGQTQIKSMAMHRFQSRFGRRFGWNSFISAAIELRKEPKGYLVQGHGFGHGIGYCMAGAQELARRGWSWRRILNFYFPGWFGRTDEN